MKKLLLTISLAIVAVATNATEPVVTTNPFVATGSKAALGRLTVKGSNIAEQGFCWATHDNPTIDDEHSTTYYENKGNLYELSPLTPGTLYYVRAYAKNTAGEVGYGEVVKIGTLQKANVTWDYDNAGDEATNERISSATKDAVEYYNTWTGIRGFNLSVHYVQGAGAGDGTADCSYGGWMRVSQNVSYQRTGTILHEASHGCGIIPWNTLYANSNGALRANGDRGDFLGWRTTQMIRFLDNDPKAMMHGDNQHMWPYGINGAHEDNGTKILYIMNVLLVHAMHQDGVQPTWNSGAAPAYTFDCNDGESYFITCEDASCGGGLAYLYETSAGTLKWQEASANELTDDSEFAWQFEYVPTTNHYRIRNVKSGKYFTYNGATIKTATKSKPATSECFQLMINYKDVTIGGNKTISKKGYWIQAGTGDWNPYSLTAKDKGATGGTQFNIAQNVTKQRWVILSGEEARKVAGVSAEVHVGHLRSLVSGAKEMLAVPHTDKAEGATETIQSIVSDMDTKVDGITGIAEAKGAVAAVEASIREYITNTVPSDIAKPYDLTCLIAEPDFATTDQWDFNELAEPTFANGVAQSSGAKFKMTQTLPDMPVGIYRVNVQACQWPAATSYVGNSVINKVDVPVMADGALANNPEQLFANGAYDNEVVFKLSKAGDLAIMAANNKSKFDEGDIMLFTNFRLYYFGNDVTKNEVTAIDSIAGEQGCNNNAIYDLQGRRIAEPVKGIYIKGGKKFIVK